MEVKSYSSDVDLEEIDLYCDYEDDGVESIEDRQQVSNAVLSYPCAVLEGLTTKWEVEFLKNHECDKDVSIPLYINFEGLILLLGNIELTMDYLLLLRYLDSDNMYKLTIHKSKDVISEVSITDPTSLLRFIKL